ncbi:MAG: Pectate lyase superfamily protein [Bacteroidetes bacterium ADurb.Bin302]|nr:MAG: Pectate lyase superfamily protein [Bacteroidetes bacterium ADurb.Bin302]
MKKILLLMMMKKILLLMMIAALVFSCKTKQPLTSTRALETVNVGAAPNDGTGDPLRTAFQKVNAAIEVMNDVSLDQATGSTGTGNLVFSASPTLTGTVTLPTATSIGDVSSTEIGYVDNVTSNIQTQLTARQYEEYDYYIEESGGTVYARPSPNTSLTAYSDALLSEVLNSAMGELTTGGKIFIAAGTYEGVDTMRVPYDNITLQGAGRYKTILKMKDNMDVGKTTFYGFVQVRNIDHFVLKDLELDGNGANQTKIDDGTTVTAICNGIHFYSSKHSRVENCFIHDFTMFGVRAHGTTHYLKIDNCHFKDNYWNNVTYSLGTKFCEVNESLLEGASDVGIALYGENATVSNSLIKYVTGTKGSGNTKVGISFESHVDYPRPKFHKIYNTTIKGAGMTVGVMSNKMEGGSTGCVIDGCTIDSAQYGISNYGDSMKIVNNTILNTSLVGVYVNMGDYNYIANNVVQSRINAYALWFWYDDGDGSTYNTVTNNTLRGGRYAYPIRIGAGCNYNRIINNHLYAQNAPGMVQDAGTGTVYNNNYDATNSLWLPNTGSGRAVQYTGDGVSVDFGEAYLKLTPVASPPGSPTEGTIYMDTDHHLYVYNGSTWVQLDN